MSRKSKMRVTNSNPDVPLEDKVEAIFIKFITVKGYSTSEALFRTLAFFGIPSQNLIVGRFPNLFQKSLMEFFEI